MQFLIELQFQFQVTFFDTSITAYAHKTFSSIPYSHALNETFSVNNNRWTELLAK
jgi:hypothetical protein